jgi:hypothetical protein
MTPGAGPTLTPGFLFEQTWNMFHAKYLSSSSLSSLKEDFLKFLLYA